LHFGQRHSRIVTRHCEEQSDEAIQQSLSNAWMLSCAGNDGFKPRNTKFPMPKTLTEIRSLARSHTRTALNVLVGVMRSKDATATARVSAANAILDRGWGKATQPIENGDDGALELIHRIERVIVHPENPHS
jgi:hypothetical protein